MKGKSKPKGRPLNSTGLPVRLKIVLEVLKEKDTLAVISKRHELHPNQISDWKSHFLQGGASIFETGCKLTSTSAEPETALLYEQIGRLQMELTFFKKSNTDQGSQFTSDDFTSGLLDQNIRISMDGKGRALDNIFVKWLWRTVK